jgi:DNA-binding transcriptional ArsR family regulator
VGAPEPRSTAERRAAHRVAGLSAMRALAHPTRVRMMHLLRSEALSASELARRLEIRFGSAQYHLRSLVRAGIALRVGERRRRGGTEILFEVPHGLWVDVGAETPLGMRQAMNHAYVAELLRRMDTASAERDDTDQDVLSTREVELSPAGVEAATEALHEFLHRLDEIALPRPEGDSMPFTVSTLFFRMPRGGRAPTGASG